jgi:mannose-6-phosphate isomerase-like protein (cupin superfamily)
MRAMKRTILTGAGTTILCVAALAQQSGTLQKMKSASGAVMKGFVANIENLTTDNSNFRRVLYTGKNLQLVLMALKPGEEIGEEVHPSTDQFFRIEKGEGEVRINGEPTKIKDGDALLVPAGARHNVVNTGSELLRLYTLYAPPEHQDGTMQATKAEAERAKEHFDGKTTE